MDTTGRGGLSFEDGAFPQVIAHEVLHHCASPHRALTEMYRVSSRSVLAFEPRDTALQRLAEKLGFAARYEIEAVAHNGGSAGGYRGGSIPNYVYRWTPREVRKTLFTYDPTGEATFRFFSSVRLPHHRFEMHRSRWRRNMLRLFGSILRLSSLVGQGNQFAFFATKPVRQHDWLSDRGLDQSWSDDRYHAMSPRRLRSERIDELAARAIASTVAPQRGKQRPPLSVREANNHRQPHHCGCR
tara:strand:- start:304 stop:1029 length:726 start_codon:yes stop_codon:yes gene_type:complete